MERRDAPGRRAGRGLLVEWRALSLVVHDCPAHHRHPLVRSSLLWSEKDMNSPRRCAVYTRKSSEEGLEQAFNSLHAQREACEAFIKSQAHEGWRLVKTAYDDGGYSGGSMDRPALQQLLADVAQ